MTVATDAGTRALLEEASEYIPGGYNSANRGIDPPLMVKRAAGAYVEDQDGNRYLDYHAAFGPIILGHCYPEVVNAVTNALRENDLYGVGTLEAEVALAKKLVHHIPSVEQVALCNSGSEATYHALRVARAHTGRTKIVKFQGCYHGWHDAVLRNVLSAPDKVMQRDPGSAGSLDAVTDSTLVCRFNDLDNVDATLRANAGEVAAIIVEPIPHNIGCLMPEPGFLEGLRTLCDRDGVVLIFDEVITGFRWAPGGAQQRFGVTPDLTTLAKIVAGGMPGGAVAGKSEMMEMLAFKDEPGWNAKRKVRHQGTYNASPVVSAAGTTCLQKAADPSVQATCDDLAARLRSGFNAAMVERGVPGYAWGESSVFHLKLGDIVPNQTGGDMRAPEGVSAEALKESAHGPRNALLRLGLMLEGVELFSSGGMTSVVHTMDDIDQTVETFGRVLDRMTAEGAFEG